MNLNLPIPELGYPKIKPVPSVSYNSCGLSRTTEILNTCTGITVASGALDSDVQPVIISRLQQAQELLPAGIHLVLEGATRTYIEHERRWLAAKEQIKAELNEDYTETLINIMCDKLIGVHPINDQHSWGYFIGGAIDVKLIDSQGMPLDMGTEIYDFSESALTAYYETQRDSLDIRRHRRYLFHSMTAAGFYNLPSEWWHFEYGTPLWGCAYDMVPLFT